MACKVHRRIALRRKLQLLRNATKAKPKSSTVMNAFLYIDKLRLQVEAIKKEYQYLMNHIQEVKVENLGTEYLVLRIRCKKGEEVLVSILEAFEEMNLNVVQASITCKHFFAMEAIVKADIDAAILNQAILKVLQMHT